MRNRDGWILHPLGDAPRNSDEPIYLVGLTDAGTRYRSIQLAKGYAN